MGWLQDTFGEDNIVSRAIENGKSVVQDWMGHFGGSTDGIDAIIDLNPDVDFSSDLTDTMVKMPTTYSDPESAKATGYNDTITGPSTTGPTKVILGRYRREASATPILFVSWVWSKSLPGTDANGITQDQTESYELTWQVDYGNGKWQNDGSPETIKVEPWMPPEGAAPYSRAAFDQFKYAEHAINSEAKLYRVLIRPISKTYDVPVGTQVQKHTYWDSNAGVSNKLDVFELNIKPPANIDIDIDANQVKITATPDDEQRDYCKKVEFQIINVDTNKVVNGSRLLIDVNEIGGSAVYTGQVPSGGTYKAHCRTVYGQLTSAWGAWSSEVTSMMIAPEKITELRTYNKDGTTEKDVKNNYVYVAWTAVKGAKAYKIQITEDVLWFDQNQGNKITTIDVTAQSGSAVPDNYHINFGDISNMLGKELYFRVIAVNKDGIDSKPTPVRSISIGLKPSAPTVWAEKYSDINTNEKGIKVYFMHNAADGSDLDSVSMYWYLESDPTKKRPIIWLKRMTNASTYYLNMRIGSGDGYSALLFPERSTGSTTEAWTGVDGNMAWVKLNPTAVVNGKPVFGDGDTIMFEVATSSVGTEGTGEWSPTTSISIYPQPEMNLELEELGDDGVMQPITGNPPTMKSYPLIVSYNTWTGGRQTAVSCDIRITADQSYEYNDEFGDKVVIPKNGEVFHRIIMLDDDTDDLLYLYPNDVDFRNGITYTVHATTMLDSGLKAEGTAQFQPIMEYIDIFPNASISVDSESLTASIRPYATDSSGKFVDNASISVYRKEYDGSFTLLSEAITPDTRTEGDDLIDFYEMSTEDFRHAMTDYKFNDTVGIHPDARGDFMRFIYLTAWTKFRDTQVYKIVRDGNKTTYTIPDTRPDGSPVKYRDYIVTSGWASSQYPLTLTLVNSTGSYECNFFTINAAAIYTKEGTWKIDGGETIQNRYGNFLEMNFVEDGNPTWNALPNFRTKPLKIKDGFTYQFSIADELKGIYNTIDLVKIDPSYPDDPMHDTVMVSLDPVNNVYYRSFVAGSGHGSVSAGDYYVTVSNIPKKDGIMILDLSLKEFAPGSPAGTELIRFVNYNSTTKEVTNIDGLIGANYFDVTKSLFTQSVTDTSGITVNGYQYNTGLLDRYSIAVFYGGQTNRVSAYSPYGASNAKFPLDASKTYVCTVDADSYEPLGYYYRCAGQSNGYIMKADNKPYTFSPSYSSPDCYMGMLHYSRPMEPETDNERVVWVKNLHLREKLKAPSGVNVVDPHPALNYARYRLVAKENTTGRVTAYDTRPIPVGEKAIVLQWNENWTDFIADGTIIPSENAWAGSMLKLPYNIDISATIDKEITDVNYIGRENPVSYYGTHLSEKSKWTTVIPRDDTETIYALRRLQKYMGDVYVREPSGIGYWAHVDVEFPINHMTVTSTVNLTITRVEGGI